MPRLTEDQVKAGLLHADADVRFAALRYFGDSYSPNPTVMPVVIEALEQFKRRKAFANVYPSASLTQTEPTVAWAVQELRTQPGGTEEKRSYLNAICRLLCNADPRLVQPHANAILAVPAFARDHQEKLARRLKFLTWDDEALWRELAVICEAGKSVTYVGDLRWDEAKDIVKQLGCQGERHVDRMMASLPQKAEVFEDDPQKWMGPLMVKLAGELRHSPAGPLIVAKVHEDDEVLSEECQTALAKIGSDDVVQAVRQDYLAGAWHFRLYASGILSRIHTDLSVQALIELLPQEEDVEIQGWLAEALVGHFSTEGNEIARKALLEVPRLTNVRDDLIVACTLMGQDFPELEAWRKQAREERLPRPRSQVEPDLSPPPRFEIVSEPRPPVQRLEKAKAGRNDPCPCGSGKKFKKCCLNKPGPV